MDDQTDYTISDWQASVGAFETTMGYSDWVRAMRDCNPENTAYRVVIHMLLPSEIVDQGEASDAVGEMLRPLTDDGVILDWGHADTSDFERVSFGMTMRDHRRIQMLPVVGELGA